MLRKLRLVNFRSFADFTVNFAPGGAYLVGPNNAGKSTVLTALRTVDVLVRYAHRRNPTLSAHHRSRSLLAYPISLTDFPALQDSLRHEFGTDEARLEVTWTSGATLVAVWPEDGPDAEEPFFFLEWKPGLLVRTTAQARSSYQALGVLPILTPVEHSEPLLSAVYVLRNVAGRLASRHFRNQLRLLSDTNQLAAFLEWAQPWLGDMEVREFGQHHDGKELILETFYYEAGSRIPKEIVWAGDGIQVWLQLLYHVHRVKDFETIVLDEPEVYLHPDLQRRLVRLLEATGKQVVLATHSAEMLAEADPRLVALVDKSNRHARRTRSEADQEMLTATLGTAFNLRLARALRSKVALFVEGQDMVVLRRFARTLNLQSVESEAGISVIQLHGYSNWGQVEPFRWLTQELLPQALKIFVVLDRDYRSDTVVGDIEQRFEAAGMSAHVWQRKELESYLLTPAVIARLASLEEQVVSQMLIEVTLTQIRE